MKKEMITIPMYGLYRIQSIDDQQYDEDSPMLFRRDSKLTDRKEIYEALEWAMENPDFDFKSFPGFEDLRFTNVEVFQYLKKFYEFMKNNKLNES